MYVCMYVCMYVPLPICSAESCLLVLIGSKPAAVDNNYHSKTITGGGILMGRFLALKIKVVDIEDDITSP